MRSVISRVVPAGTVMPLRTIVEQDPLPDAAASASVKVHPEEAVTDEAELAASLAALAVAPATEEELPAA